MGLKPRHTRPQRTGLLTLNSDFIEMKGKRLLGRVFAGLIGSYSNYKIGVVGIMSCSCQTSFKKVLWSQQNARNQPL